MHFRKLYVGIFWYLRMKIRLELEKVTRFTGFRMGSPSVSTVCSSPKYFTLEKLYSFSYYLYAGG